VVGGDKEMDHIPEDDGTSALRLREGVVFRGIEEDATEGCEGKSAGRVDDNRRVDGSEK
jgi:hypothetical protein